MTSPDPMKECTALTNHENWCDCGKPECWEEQLRLRVRFDKNADREVCILFIHRLLAHRDAALVEKVSGMKKEKPKGKCMNAENHLFGNCFECCKIDGHNTALDAVISLITNRENV